MVDCQSSSWLYRWIGVSGTFFPTAQGRDSLLSLLLEGWEVVGEDQRYPNSVLLRKRL